MKSWQTNASKAGNPANSRSASIAFEVLTVLTSAIPWRQLDYLLKKVTIPHVQAMFEDTQSIAQHGREENGFKTIEFIAPRLRSFSYFTEIDRGNFPGSGSIEL